MSFNLQILNLSFYDEEDFSIILLSGLIDATLNFKNADSIIYILLPHY